MSFKNTKIDFYDDKGSLLRTNVPAEEVPDFVKEASIMSGDESSNLYALVLLEDGNSLKKFATADAGNSWLSALYFAKNRHLLPVEAQKIAASNIKEALNNFGIEPPSVIEKMASDQVDTNFVDVTGKSAPRIVREQPSDIEYALELANGSKRYPLGNAEAVKTALSYFELHKGQFIPRERREYAVKVASVANKYGLSVTDSLSEYAGSEYSSAALAHVKLRKDYLSEDAYPELSKLAAKKETLDAPAFAAELAVFDREHGLDELWDSMLVDPWASTLAPLEKVANGSRESTFTFQMGNEIVTEEELVRLSKLRKVIVDNFGMDIANKFADSPVDVFKSMPLPQKKVLASLARDVTDSGVY